jgi:predicted lactoylglutathione lyase
MDQRISMITLGVDDLVASTAFYRRLGWTPSAKFSNEAITFFRMNGMVLALFGWKALAEDATVADEGKPGFRGVTVAYNTRTREGVDEALAQAERAGARIVKAAQEVFWGGYCGYFADPDGHLWEVTWNPLFPLAEDGSVVLPE